MKLFSITGKMMVMVGFLALAIIGNVFGTQAADQLPSDINEQDMTINECNECDETRDISIVVDAVVQEVKKATDCLKNKDIAEIPSAWNALFELVNDGYGYNEAIAIANEYITYNFPKQIRLMALRLFAVLVSKKQAYQDTLNVVNALKQDKDLTIQLGVLDVFTALIKQGYAYDDAQKFAEQALQDQQCRYIKDGGLAIFAVLVRQGVALKDAFDAVMKCSDEAGAANVFAALVDQGQAYKEALALANKLLLSEDYEYKVGAFQIFAALVRKGQAYNEAFTALINGLMDQDFPVSAAAIPLCKALLDQKQIPSCAIFSTIDSMLKTNIWEIKPEDTESLIEKVKLENHDNIKCIVATILHELLQQGVGYKEITASAMKKLSSNDSKVRAFALDLLIDLVDQGQAYKEAEQAIYQEVERSRDNISVVKALTHALLKNGKGLGVFMYVFFSYLFS